MLVCMRRVNELGGRYILQARRLCRNQISCVLAEIVSICTC